MAATLTEDARKKANLRVLQRSDSAAHDILGHATHVVLYEFHRQHQKWEKLDVEGSLFLVKRTAVPRFRLVVLNRSTPHNFQVDLTPHFQLQHNDPYLIFRQDDTIKGIWFHSPKERQDMASLLHRVVQSLEVDPTAATRALLQTVSLNGDLHTNVPDSVPTTPVASTAATGGGSSATTPPPSAAAPPVLDKKSLQLALLSLIQDDRFLDLIHAQYAKVAQARAQASRKPHGTGES